MSGSDTPQQRVSPIPLRNGDSSAVAADAFDGDLLSAIASSIAQGEASRKTAAAALLPNGVVSSAQAAASTSYNAYTNGYTSKTTATHTAQNRVISNRRLEEAPKLATDQQVVDRLESSTITTHAEHTVTRPNGNFTLASVEAYYAPMSDSEPEDAAPPLPLNGANGTGMEEATGMFRSPSVSYVDPEVDLSIEQDRGHMMEYNLPELNGSATPMAGIDYDDLPQSDQTKQKSRSISFPVPEARNNQPSTSNRDVLQEAFVPIAKREHTPREQTPPSSAEKGKGRIEASTPVDQGWGISGQHTPSRAATYDEVDELDELASTHGNTPRIPENQFKVPSLSGTSASIQANVAEGTSNKGKERVKDDDEDALPDSSYSASTARTEDAPLYFKDDDEFSPSSTSRKKGKERARDAATPAQDRGETEVYSPVFQYIPRPAVPRRKYKGLERLEKAASLALNRDMTYLDIALEDDGRTCWIRCVNWDISSEFPNASNGHEEDAVEENGNDQNSVEVDNRRPLLAGRMAQWTTASHVRRSRQRETNDTPTLDNTQSSTAQSSPTRPSRITCQAEVLAELVDGDIGIDKWRVIRVNEVHSIACEMIIKQAQANEILEKANIGIQAEVDPELAEDILAASYQGPDVGGLVDEEENPESSSVIQESLDSVKRRRVNGETFFNAENVQQDLPNDNSEDGAPISGPSGTRRRETSPEQDNLSNSKSTTTEEHIGRRSSRTPGLLRRLYESFSASSTTSSTQCAIGDTFKTKDEVIDAATAALSLPRTHVFVRYGVRFKDAVPFVDVFCPCHEDLTTNERNTVKNVAGHSHDCSAHVKAYFKKHIHTWMKSSAHLQHSPNCPAVKLAAAKEAAEVSKNKPNGHFQPASRVTSRENSVSSTQNQKTPVLQEHMPFYNSVDLRQAASRALGRDLSQLGIKESQHPVFPKQSTCNLHCQEYAFGQSRTTSRGWSSLVPRMGLGGGNQPSQCMAFVEASMESDDQPWRIASFQLEHSARCQSEYEQAKAASVASQMNEEQTVQTEEAERLPPQSMLNPARAAFVVKSASASSSRSGHTTGSQPIDNVQAAYAPRVAAALSGSRSSSSASAPRVQDTLQPAAHIVSEQGMNFPASGGNDGDIEFVGAHEAPPAPEIPIGAVYKPNDLAKLAQKLSTFVNKGSEVVWTQKPGNVPRALACKYALGFKQDKSAGFTCTFRVTAKFNQGKVQVESVFDQHSPACLVNHGNRPAFPKPVKSESVPRSLIARETGSTAPVRQEAITDSCDEEMIQSQLTRRQLSPADMPDPFQDDNISEDRQVESSQAAQRRAVEVTSAPSTSHKPKKRKRDDVSPRTPGRSKYSTVLPRPQEGRVYNSVHHFINDVKGYSEAKSPAADLRRSDVKGGQKGQRRRPDCVVLECSFPECPFRVAGRTMQDSDGRELEGFQILPSVAKHSRECRNTERTKRKPRTSTSKSASVIEIESFVQPGEKSDEDVPVTGKKRKSGQSNVSQASQGGKRRRIEDSDETSAPLPPSLSTSRKSPTKRRESPSPPSSFAPIPDLPAEGPMPGLRSPTHSSRGGTPAPLVATHRTNGADDDDMGALFASYHRNPVKDEPQSPRRPPGHIKLYTGQIFDSRDAFVNAVLQHTEERNPGCRLSVANTDPARVRVYCMRADCAYSFNSVYEHGARQIPAVKVTANHRDHSATCLSFYQRVGQSEQRVHFDAPMVDQEIGDWHDFESAVQAHTDSVNPGCELKTTKGPEHLRVYCPHRDLGCKYSFRAKFDIAEIQEGRVKVTNARTEHSDGCLEHHKRIAEEEAEEEEALNPGLATKRSKPSGSSSHATHPAAVPEQPRLGPGPHPGDQFDNETAFRSAVEAHSQLVNPGSSLSLRRLKDNLNLQCRNIHTGCRYEFYAAYHPPAEDSTRRVTVTDLSWYYKDVAQLPTANHLCGPPLVPPTNGPSKPLKRTRFEDIAASSTDSSQAPLTSNNEPTHTNASDARAGASTSSESGTVSASLLQVMQDQPHAAALLGSLGYHTIADLKRIGVSVEDWPDLFQFLAGCDPESFRAMSDTGDGQLDPLEKFLLQRRARLAFSDEAQGQFRHL